MTDKEKELRIERDILVEKASVKQNEIKRIQQEISELSQKINMEKQKKVNDIIEEKKSQKKTVK